MKVIVYRNINDILLDTNLNLHQIAILIRKLEKKSKIILITENYVSEADKAVLEKNILSKKIKLKENKPLEKTRSKFITNKLRNFDNRKIKRHLF